MKKERKKRTLYESIDLHIEMLFSTHCNTTFTFFHWLCSASVRHVNERKLPSDGKEKKSHILFDSITHRHQFVPIESYSKLLFWRWNDDINEIITEVSYSLNRMNQKTSHSFVSNGKFRNPKDMTISSFSINNYHLKLDGKFWRFYSEWRIIVFFEGFSRFFR